MIIGITGTDGAGKGAVVSYLVKQHGFTHYSSRSFILDEIKRQGLPETRNQMRLTANELRGKYGNEFVVKQAYERAAAEQKDKVVIESVRAIAEAHFLKQAGGMLLAVDADQQLRYERVQGRRSESDQVTFAEFQAHEELEKNDPDPNGMQKAKVMEMADCTIMNDGSMKELHEKVEAFLKEFAPRTIQKSAWLCIKDRKVLFARSHNNTDTFYLPGGKREEGETDEEALIREIKEETTVELLPDTVRHAATFSHHAHGKPSNVTVELKGYFADFTGELTAADEISELAWFDSTDMDKVYGVGVKTLEWLKEQDLIN